MSNGGYKGASPARETSPEQYPGVWELTEQFQAQADGNWPFQADDNAPKSLRFNSSDSSFLSRTPAVAGNRRTWTWSGWVKQGSLATGRQCLFGAYGAANDTDFLDIGFDGNSIYATANSANTTGTAKYRDPSAWFHYFVRYNGTNVKWFINGVEAHSWARTGNLAINGAWAHQISRSPGAGGRHFDGYLADVHFIDGQALEPIDFGFYDGQGIWQPKRFTGDYSSGPVYSHAVPTADGFRPNRIPYHGFDGDLTTYIALNNTTFNLDVGSWGLSGTLEVYTGSNHQYAVDGGSASSMTASGWTNVGNASSITTLTLTRTDGNYPYFNAVRLNGVILTDASVGRNSFHLDFSDGVKDQSGVGNDWTPNNIESDTIGGLVQDWESMLTGAHDSNHGWGTLYGSDNMFDGSLTTYTIGQANATGLTFTPTTALGASATTIRIYGMDDACPDSYLKINGVNYGGLVNSGTGWTVLKGTGAVGSGITSITSIYLRDNSLGNQHYRFAALEIDGVIVTQGSNADVFVDSPVNGNEASTGAGGERRGSYCTWNPLDQVNATLTNGNLDCSLPANASNYTRGTISVTSGKWFWEVTLNSGVHGMIGISQQDYPAALSYTQGVLFYYVSNGNIYGNVGRSGTYSSYGNGLSAGDVLGIALDMDNGNVKFYKNGTAEGGNANSSTLRGLTISPCLGEGGGAMTTSTNFGQRSFSQTPPTGYSPLATSFLPEPTIKRGDEAMAAVVYSGNNSNNKIKLKFAPDILWLKSTTSSTYGAIASVVEGANYFNPPNDTGAQKGPGYSDDIESFDDDGFTLGSDTYYAAVNRSPNTYSAFAWDAGDTTTSIAAGGLNSSAYNQSSRWSASSGLANPKNAFDGDLSTGGVVNSSGTAITVTTASFTGKRIRFYKNGNNDAQLTTITINGTAYTLPQQSTSTGWVELDLGSSTTVTSFTTTWYGNYTLHAIEVDGRILTDAFNDSQTWSGNITTTGNSGTFHSSYPATNAFNDNDTNYAHGNGDGSQTAVVTLTLSPGVSCSNTVSFLGGMTTSGTATISVNGGTAVNLTSGSSATTKTNVSFTGTVTSIVITKTSSDASGMLIYGFEIDGARLVDNGVRSLPNVPTLATTVRANPSTGCSAIKYSGGSDVATVAHGLNKEPHFAFFKKTQGGEEWGVYHRSLGNAASLRFKVNTAGTSLWQSLDPTSFAMPLSYQGAVNESGGNYLGFLWTSIEGFSSFGSFEGNNLDPGPFVYLGFRAKLIFLKNADASQDWIIYDTSRSTSNEAFEYLGVQYTAAQNSTADDNSIDILSNGFIPRAATGTNDAINAPGNTIIYCAWAEHPFASNPRAR